MMKSPFHVVHLSTEMSMGGGERQLLYLYKGLQERNISQVIICAENSKLIAYCQKYQYAYLTLKRRGAFSLKYAWELKCMLAEIAHGLPPNIFRLVHCHDAHAHTHAVLADLMSSKASKWRLIIHKKVVPKVLKKGFKSWLKTLKYRYSGIHRIIAVSQATANVCSSWTTADKIAVLHDTLDLREYFSPKSSSTFTIGIIGSLIPVKDHEFFLHCAKRILTIYPFIQFWIIGDGPLKERLEKQAQELGIFSHIKFWGFREDIPELLSQLDVLMVTSKNEGLCSTILQAMAAKVPVIAREVGGIPEIVQNNKNGLLAQTAEDFVRHIQTLHENHAIANRLRQEAFAFVQSYDLPLFTEKMLSFYS